MDEKNHTYRKDIKWEEMLRGKKNIKKKSIMKFLNHLWNINEDVLGNLGC